VGSTNGFRLWKGSDVRIEDTTVIGWANVRIELIGWANARIELMGWANALIGGKSVVVVIADWV
jgi:hypothetical protein